MSIAINTHGTHAPARRFARTIPAERKETSRSEQLREGRALMRHLVLGAVSVGTILYAVFAAGLTF